MLEVAGVALLAIEDSDPDSAMVRQCFVSLQPVIELQPVIDMMNFPPQALGIQQGVHTSAGVGTAYALPEPVTEKARASGKFQSIETTHLCPDRTVTDLLILITMTANTTRQNSRFEAHNCLNA
jgi:hypothetical protein